MAGQGILLNLEEGSVLCCIVLLQTGCVFEEVCLAGFFPVFSPVLGQRSLLARIICHFVSAFLTSALPGEGKLGVVLKLGGGVTLLDDLSLCAAL